jgi:hypothetical protein
MESVFLISMMNLPVGIRVKADDYQLKPSHGMT